MNYWGLMNMIKVDCNKGTCDCYGDTLDLLSDIAFALSNVVDFMTVTQMARKNWNDTLDFTLNAIRHSIETYKEEQNDTLG